MANCFFFKEVYFSLPPKERERRALNMSKCNHTIHGLKHEDNKTASSK